MIFEFNQPVIVDTKNIYSTFTKRKHVPKEFIPKIKRITKQRKAVKETLKFLALSKTEDTPPYNLIEEVIKYADSAVELDFIFERDYSITKNWKWTPFLSETKVLKFSHTIKYGKSAEILLSRYAAFAACFRSVKADIAFIKHSLLEKSQVNLFDDLTYSTLLMKTPTINKLEESILKVVKVQTKAYMLLNTYYKRSSTYFRNLANYPQRFFEIGSAGMEITLLLTKINTNILYIEYLRLQGNNEEAGKYAKMIVTQAFLIQNILKTQNYQIDYKVYEFVKICQILYKAIALWSLFYSYLAKIKTTSYAEGEDINILAGGACSIITYISSLHKSLIEMPEFRASALYGICCLYFKDVFLPKSKEVKSLYSDIFRDYPYNDFHFDRMEELDYMSRMTGE